MEAIQKLCKEFKVVFVTRPSWCRKIFDYFFTVTIGAIIMTVLEVLGYIQERQATRCFIVLVFLIIILSFIGDKIYRKFADPFLSRRGWNQNSFLRSLELLIILVGLFWFLPVFLYFLFA